MTRPEKLAEMHSPKWVHFVTCNFHVTVQLLCRYCINFHNMEIVPVQLLATGWQGGEKRTRREQILFMGKVEIEDEIKS